MKSKNAYKYIQLAMVNNINGQQYALNPYSGHFMANLVAECSVYKMTHSDIVFR